MHGPQLLILALALPLGIHSVLLELLGFVSEQAVLLSKLLELRKGLAHLGLEVSLGPFSLVLTLLNSHLRLRFEALDLLGVQLGLVLHLLLALVQLVFELLVVLADLRCVAAQLSKLVLERLFRLRELLQVRKHRLVVRAELGGEHFFCLEGFLLVLNLLRRLLGQDL